MGAFEFSGEFVEENEEVWMKSSMKKREEILKRHRIMFLLMFAFALILLLSMNPLFMIMAVLFLVIPIINKGINDKSNAFYKAIIKRVMK